MADDARVDCTVTTDTVMQSNGTPEGRILSVLAAHDARVAYGHG